MTTDKSSPRIRAIAMTALVTVVVLVGLRFAFDSYYVTMFEAEEQRKVASVQPTDLFELRAAEKRAFAHARVPLERAMEIVARGRTEPIPGLEDGGVTPEPSNDTAPLVGWAGLANDCRSDASPASPSAGATPSAAVAAPAPPASGAPSPSAPPRSPADAAPR